MTVFELLTILEQLNIKLALDNDKNLIIRGDKSKLTNDLIGSIKKSKPEIVKLLLKQPLTAALNFEICDRSGDIALSYAQQRLWMLDQIEGSSAQYNIANALKLDGKIDIAALTNAFNRIIMRHESLRTCFTANAQGRPFQVIQENVELDIPLQDISNTTGEAQRLLVEEILRDEAERTFDLSKDIMLRIQLVRLAEESHLLLVTMHHIASDGWSMAILINEFCQLYHAHITGDTASMPPLAIQYADYAHWQRSWLKGDELHEQLDYWAQQLAGIPEVHGLPLDNPRPAEQAFKGGRVCSVIDKAQTERLNALCQKQGATLFMGLQALFALLLSRYSNETDIVMGSPIANREQEEVAGLIGFFVNTLVLRSDLSLNPSFSGLITQSKTMLLSAYAHQQVPFEQIVERLKPTRSLSHSPLFQVMLVLQNNEEGELHLPDLALSLVERQEVLAKYELTLNVIETDQGLSLDWQYNTAIFNEDTIARMASYFNVLLSSVLAAPELPVQSLEVLSATERSYLLAHWNDTQVSLPAAQCMHELFEAQVEKNGEATAVVCGGNQLSYVQLNSRANQLAHYLIKEGVKPGSLVGICLERSVDMVIAILATMKAGGVYVPLDPHYPETRLRYMIEDAQLSTILTQRSVLLNTSISAANVLCLDDDVVYEALDNRSITNLPVISLGLTSSDLAYIIYTSGSTGNPKGVEVIHRGLINYVNYAVSHYFADVKTAIVSSPLAFDATVTSLLSPLINGCQVQLLEDNGEELEQLAVLLQQLSSPALFKLTPSHLEGLALLSKESKFNDINHRIVLGGEQLKSHNLFQWKQTYLPAATFINEYGPTETVVGCSTYFVRDIQDVKTNQSSIPIGKPIHNTQLYVLNSQLSPVPIGAPGELYIGGVGLARGYLNRDELTAERFIENPFYDENIAGSSQRLYKTGDLVRWLPDGNLVFLGRLDHQVKLRGFRIELGEIEHTIGGLENVRDVVVIARSDNGQHEQQLVAYVVEEAAAEISDKDKVVTQLRQHVEAVLPDYMVPSAFVVMESLPLTPNGKVDRKALPAPDFSQQQESYVAPSTETERLLCAIWQDVLGIEQVGVKDNFFALGGHSLLVIQVIARLQEIGKSISAKVLFSAKTLSDVAAAIDASVVAETFKVPANEIPENCEHITPEMLPLVDLDEQSLEYIVNQVPGGAGNIQDIYPLGPLQKGILFHHMMSEQGDPYVLPALFKVNGKTNLASFKAALEFVIGRHDVLRTAILWEGLPTPVQVVYKEAVLRIEEVAVEAGMDVMDIMSAKSAPESQSMDLSQGPLIQLQVAAMDDDAFIVLLQYHHIISDHVGLEIIQSEIAAYMQGKADTLLPSKAFRGFVAHALHQEKNNDAHAYFESLLGDVEEPTAPFNLLDVQGDGSQIVELRAQVRPALSSKLREVAKRLAVSPAAIFHAAWSLLISGCSGRDDVVFGTVVSGRLQGTMGAESMLGVFINTLPFRVKLQGVTALELVEQVQERLVSLLPYEQTSLAEAQKCSGLPGGTPLFSALLNYRHTANEGAAEQKAIPECVEYLGGQEWTNYPFDMSVDDLGTEFELEAQVDASISAERIISYMQAALENLVCALELSPEQAADKICILSDVEKNKLIVDWNNTDSEYPAELCIQQLFEQQVSRNPNGVSLIIDEKQLSYEQLNAHANQLAHYLIQNHGVRPDTMVGICLDRSLDMIISIMGILKAGGAYIPLDPALPESRLQYIIQDANLDTVLTSEAILSQISQSFANTVCLDERHIIEQLSQLPKEDILPSDIGLLPSHLAYVIYTSGSTGNPKGVMVEHRSLVNLATLIQKNYSLKAEDRFLQFATINFDMSIEDIFGALSSGSQLVLRTDSWLSSPENFWQLCSDYNITVLDLPTAFWHELAKETGVNPPPCIRHISIGGEQVSNSALALWFERDVELPKLVNTYGPTECTVDAAFSTIVDERNSIGSAIDNYALYVTNKNGLLAPIGVAGELLIGGVGLARGYLNNENLTKEKFVENPFYDSNFTSSSERLYRTGDLVKWLPDGTLAFLGRIDDQVKIRGFRIELGEVESALKECGCIQDAIVIPVSVGEADKHLAAYIIPSSKDIMSSSNPDSDIIQSLVKKVRQQLALMLPDYMIPQHIIAIEQIPLTTNGKVDKNSLPEPGMLSMQDVYVGPETETERVLCKVWELVLGCKKVSTKDNFFALGGHSLLVMQVIAKLQEKDILVTARQLFTAPTLASLATEIDKAVSVQGKVFKAPKNKIPTPCNRVTPEMLPLVNLTEDEINLIASKVPGGMENIQDIYPLGPLQEGILFHHRMNTKGDPYILPAIYKIEGREAVDELLKALRFVIERYDVLRTAVLWHNLSTAVQVVCRQVELPVTWLTLPVEQEANEYISTLCTPENQSMDLSDAPLVHLKIVQQSNDDTYFVLLQEHHIISDHVGLEIIERELSLYQGGQSHLLKEPTPYREFVAHALYQAKHNNAESFFSQMLGDVEAPTAPFELVDVQGNGSQINEVKQSVSAQLSARIRGVAKDLQVSPAAIFHAAWAVLLAGCSAKSDVVFGTVVSGRLQGTTDAENMMGVFINTLPMRVDLNNVSATALIEQVHQSLLALLPYEQTSLALAQKCSAIQGSTPLFSALLNYRHSSMAKQMGDELTDLSNHVNVETIINQERTNYPFNLSVDDFSTDFAFDVQVDSTVDAGRIASYMQEVLAKLIDLSVTSSSKYVSSLQFLPPCERERLLVEWNGVEEEFPSDKCIHQLFEEQAAITPDAIAVTFESEHIRYSELNSRANQLAHYLIEEHQVKPDSLIGVCFERSVDMLVSILAVLKAGGAYVPLDPNYPQSRLTYMMLDASLNTVLTESDLQESVQGASIQAVCVDAEHIQLQVRKYSVENIEPSNIGLTASHLAYVIYTSGSTGNPKGVMVEHRNITRLMASTEADFQFDSQDVWTMFHSYAFDFSVWEIWGALSYGGRLVIVPYWVSRSSSDFYQLLADEQVTVLNQTPSAFSQVIQEDKKATNTKLALRYVIFGGEALNLESLTPWIEKYGDNHPQLINMYGITETTVHVTRQRITQEVIASSQGASTIGRALKDLNLVVLNEHNMLVPTGVAGEMYIAGAGVTRGYLNQAALTAARFVQLPELGEQRFYKTGDLARYTENGDLEYLGRLDHQVKLRGFRIELGEIESALTRSGLVNDAVVQVKESTDGNKRLVGYLALGKLPQEDTSAMFNSLKGYLSEQLPSHMVPAVFVCLEELPLTGNGKVDRKALPEPDISQQQGKYVAPSTATEKVLCEIWQEVLGIERVGITDDFFDIGGHSLLVMKFLTELEHKHSVIVPVKTIFQFSNIQNLAAYIEIATPLEADGMQRNDQEEQEVEMETFQL
ncbi:hypothetical protein PA25_12240 [Pseudoalteromonas sp. A25]|uniref:non-ribosomal peptide synthetase n=1 Tax=Pseudoalteromonas sp. A25 TaxID=116092 RepID=UPI001260FA85|nr:non-ribosomal peptide synthetase [Pseudoalteromonas sp. A25]BBN81239.1 hypothetical protein PA25_12240 [Pseudoalteromonas sp. A25]